MNLFDLFATLHFDSSSFDRGVRSAESKMNSLSSIFSSGFSSMGGALKNIGSSISAFGKNVTRVGQAASVVTAGVGAVLGSAFVKAKDYIGTYESAMATFKHSAQVGEQGAQALFDALLNVAQHSAYAREHFFAAGQALVAMGLDANKTTKYVQAITDTVAKMGGSGQQIEEMADLFGKLSLQTNLYTQDINQMVTAGIPAWDILATHYHTTTDEVKKMAKQGLIPAAESLDIITDAIEETNEASEMFRFSAAGMANELKQGTLTGALDSLNSSFRAFAVSILDLDPATDSGKENIRTLNKAILTFGETLKVVGTKFGFVGDWIKAGLEQITAFLEKFNKAVENMPQDKAEKIAKVIGIIAAAGPTLLGAGKAITFVGESFKGVGGLFEFVGKGIGSVIGSIEGHFASFGNFFSSLLPSFSKIGSGILDVFKPMGDQIGGVLSGIGEKVGSFLGGLGGKVGGFLGPLAEKIGGFLGPIGEKLGGGIIEIFGKVAGFAPQMMSAFMSLFNLAAIAGAIFAGLGLIQQNFGEKISEISNFLMEKGPEIITNFANGIIEKLPTLIEQGSQLVMTLVNTINANLPAIINSGMTILSTLVTGFAQQLPTLIPLAVQTILILVEGIANNIDQILNAGIALINGIVTGITNSLPLLTEKAPEIINNLVNGIVSAIPQLMDTAGKMIETILQVITANLPAILNGGIRILVELVKGIAHQLPTLIPAAIEAVLTFVETLIDNIGQFIDAGISLIIGLAEGLIKAIPKIIDKIPTIIEKLINAIVENLPKLLEMGVRLIVELAVGLVKAIPQLVSKIPDIIWAITNGLGGAVGEVFNIGKNLVEGLWNGINDMVGWIGGKISEFGDNILNGLKSFFGIASPSKLMRDKVGKYLAEGIGEGFSDTMSSVEKSMVKDMQDLSNNLQIDDITYGASVIGKSNANMVNAMSSMLTSTSGKEINIYIGGKKIANEIYDPLMEIMKSKEVYVGA